MSVWQTFEKNIYSSHRSWIYLHSSNFLCNQRVGSSSTSMFLGVIHVSFVLNYIPTLEMRSSIKCTTISIFNVPGSKYGQWYLTQAGCEIFIATSTLSCAYLVNWSQKQMISGDVVNKFRVLMRINTSDGNVLNWFFLGLHFLVTD